MNQAETIPESVLEMLRETGWVGISGDTHEEAALTSRTLMFAKQLGTPTPGRARHVVELLRPKTPETAQPASLSRNYGLQAFPFHVDTAHWTVPARFLLISCVHPGDVAVPTLLVDRDSVQLAEEEKALAKSAVFLIKNGRNSFYSSILGSRQGFIRYDPGCMEPQTQDAVEALKFYSHERVRPSLHEVNWNPGETLIIDNWRILHARAAVGKNSSNRLLLRCLVS
jgi:Taurine catabolism dioxygenase TauD, TfdA family